MTTEISPTWTAEKAKHILDLVHADIREGVYTPVPGTVTELQSFSDLHDFVDANEYLADVMGWDALDEEYAAVSILVDALLSESPINL
jgi:hypothetical protein